MGAQPSSLQTCCHAHKSWISAEGEWPRPRLPKAERNGLVGEHHAKSPLSVVFVEGNREDSSERNGCSIGQPDQVCLTRVRGMMVLKTPQQRPRATLPENLEEVVHFGSMLRGRGIDTTRWGTGGAKSVEHLYWEVHVNRSSILVGIKQQRLKRIVRLLKIRIIADICGVNHVLVSRMQLMHDGRQIQRRQVPLRKLRWKLAPEAAAEAFCDASFFGGDSPHTESWRDCCSGVLLERLGLTSQTVQAQLEEDMNRYSYHTEDNVISNGYPGLNTLYCVHQVTFRVINPEDPDVALLGLPQGKEIATADSDFNFNGAVNIGSQLNIWFWTRDEDLLQPQRDGAASPPNSPTPSSKGGSLHEAKRPKSWGIQAIKRVPLPETVAEDVIYRRADSCQRPPSKELWAALRDKSVNWAAARRMARSIMDADYSLTSFYQDLAAFPELSLYLRDGGSLTSSSRTVGDEYQRTVCAFFAIYWLMRMDSDGRDGFTFGVDTDWVPLKSLHGEVDLEGAASEEQRRLFNLDRRVSFYKEAKWDFFRNLLCEARLLEEVKDKEGQAKKTADGKKQYKANERRMVSLLALTAIHDIMKMDVLLPTVQPEHAGYHGYAAGNVIGDHDHALSYLMEHFPDALPSFADLDPVERRAVQFTQCNLCFNHGWFVQAEAPPGAIFTKFREAIIHDHKSEVDSHDVALYFVHWLTDLAGAEPTPLGGCEKFVVKFPLPVLNSFLRSFKFVEQIAVQTETEVMETYLKYRWTDFKPSLGELPTGPTAITVMRLLCMAQANGQDVVEAFTRDVPAEDRAVLSMEMSRTGCVGQSYSKSLVPAEVIERPACAFLIYYGPAFLQARGSDPLGPRLRVLAEVYRCAREIWPESPARVAHCVHVRIDTMKGLSLTEIRDIMQKGELWLLTKHNDSEAFVERASHKKLNTFVSKMQQFQLLDLGFLVDCDNFNR